MPYEVEKPDQSWLINFWAILEHPLQKLGSLLWVGKYIHNSDAGMFRRIRHMYKFGTRLGLDDVLVTVINYRL